MRESGDRQIGVASLGDQPERLLVIEGGVAEDRVARTPQQVRQVDERAERSQGQHPLPLPDAASEPDGGRSRHAEGETHREADGACPMVVEARVEGRENVPPDQEASAPAKGPTWTGAAACKSSPTRLGHAARVELGQWRAGHRAPSPVRRTRAGDGLPWRVP